MSTTNGTHVTSSESDTCSDSVPNEPEVCKDTSMVPRPSQVKKPLDKESVNESSESCATISRSEIVIMTDDVDDSDRHMTDLFRNSSF